MSNHFVSIDSLALANVNGGKNLSGIIEGGRKLLQAGAVAWNTLMPGHAPIKPPPSPQRIERVRPNPQGQVSKGGGQE
jgi:hypothetical protein